MCYNNLLCCESTGDGGGTVRRVSEHREIGKKMQKKKMKKKQQEKNVVSGQCTCTVTFAGLKVCEG